ncbi:ABC transporter substrate-binding protein [Pseudoxanthobacter sp.]|uniref:ABC transporter substrate-binding protein n=1 Tax=Pseudoxanthobacter sp. TaxID=1925742 RepID=UPI002FE2C6B8
MKNAFRRRFALTLALAAAAGALATGSASAEMIGNCEVTGTKGQFPLTPAIPGQLTVEVNLPAPGWWNGDTPETIKDGYEYCLGANIAWRAGLDKVGVKNVAWDALVAGQTKDFDLALSQISITDERKKVVDFSVPYFSSDVGVLVKDGTALDAATMKDAQIGVQQGTTGATFVDTVLKPSKAAKVFPDTPSMFTALMAGQIDAAMTDTAIVLGQAAVSGGKFKVIGQYNTGETYGAIYPKGSPNAKVLNEILTSLIDDGTTKKLASKYLTDAWGIDPTTIPTFKP